MWRRTLQYRGHRSTPSKPSSRPSTRSASRQICAHTHKDRPSVCPCSTTGRSVHIHNDGSLTTYCIQPNKHTSPYKRTHPFLGLNNPKCLKFGSQLNSWLLRCAYNLLSALCAYYVKYSIHSWRPFKNIGFMLWLSWEFDILYQGI